MNISILNGRGVWATVAASILGILRVAVGVPQVVYPSPTSDGKLLVRSPSADPCGASWQQDGVSACWRTDGYSSFIAHASGEFGAVFPHGGVAGFPMNLSLAYGVGPGDYPPLSAAIEASASPLMPAKHAQFSAPNPFQSRAMIEGSC